MSRFDDTDVLRRCIFRPYRKGMGPSFRLMTWDTGRTDSYGKTCIGYRLTMYTPRDDQPWARRSVAVTLFEGEDYYCSPMHAIDSDESVRSLMTFLTLRPGDTDAGYFEDYTDAQRDYCGAHAETLSYEVINRFGEG